MDEVDKKQQEELDELRRVDKRHDRDIIVFRVLGVVIMLCTLAMFAITMETMSKSGPYNCPHPDCVHHRSNE